MFNTTPPKHTSANTEQSKYLKEDIINKSISSPNETADTIKYNLKLSIFLNFITKSSVNRKFTLCNCKKIVYI